MKINSIIIGEFAIQTTKFGKFYRLITKFLICKMICHKYKCIFVHQRKTAGSSVISAFGHSPNAYEWHAFNDGVLSENPSWLKKTDFSNYFVFAVTRNPWDRFISGWKYCNSTRDRELLDVLTNLPQDGHDYRHLTRPQVSTLIDTKGELITDYLIRFENIQQDFNEVCDFLKKPRIRLPVLNKTPHYSYNKYFKESKTRFLFEKLFSEDIEYLGYKF